MRHSVEAVSAGNFAVEGSRDPDNNWTGLGGKECGQCECTWVSSRVI